MFLLRRHARAGNDWISRRASVSGTLDRPLLRITPTTENRGIGGTRAATRNPTYRPSSLSGDWTRSANPSGALRCSNASYIQSAERRIRRGISSMITLSAPSEPTKVDKSSRDAMSKSSSMVSALVASPVGK